MSESPTTNDTGKRRSKSLTFGYLYDFRRFPGDETPIETMYARTLDLIEWTESVGFGGAWVPEHHGAPDGYQPLPQWLGQTRAPAPVKPVRVHGRGVREREERRGVPVPARRPHPPRRAQRRHPHRWQGR